MHILQRQDAVLRVRLILGSCLVLASRTTESKPR
jgi:hypothetical protein